jgi:molybdate transport system substrate-binding protein
MMSIRFCALLLAALTLSTWSGARAQTVEITLIAPGGFRAALDALIPGFEEKTGYAVKPTYGSGNATKQQVVHGEPFDVPVVQPPYADVIASGNVVASSATPLASVAVGVAVRKGAPKPDISTPDAVRRLLLGAKSIAYPDAARGAGAGISFEQTLHTLGIYDQVQAKATHAQSGDSAMALTAGGQVEVGLTYLSEMENGGIDVVGPLPAAIAPPTPLVGFVSAHAKNPAAAKALLEYLTSRAAQIVYRANRMLPGR